MYNPLTEEIAAKIRAVSDHTFYGYEVNPDYSRDEMPIYGTHMPEMAVQPRSTEEVAAVMKICYENNIPVTPRGAGTGLVGGSVPLYGGVTMDLSKMNRILEYDLENFDVRIEPGVLLSDLVADCMTRGMLYPVDPGEKYACLGGNVSTNAGGMRAVKYGTTREYVKAMTVVLPTGEVTRFGAAVSKTSSGYSLKDLIIGSEGTLGIITELTLKIIPAPKEVISLIIPFTDLGTALATVPKFKTAGLDPQAVEFMEREIVLASEEYIGKEVFPANWNGIEIEAFLLVTFDGSTKEDVNRLTDEAAEIALDSGALDVLIADTSTRIRNAWSARSSFLEAIMDQYELIDECDVVVPVDKIADYMEFVNRTGDDLGFEVRSFGHAGDGNIHIYQCSNSLSKEEFLAKGEIFFDTIYREASRLGGLISGEHGIGHGKTAYLAESVGEINVELMKGIKKVFDPKLILNPGKVVRFDEESL
ncbi:MAG: FAD-binding oxidoreductase [Firmicutes bacterium]|nr:FAD-binding oxidoreductase [Bacillota bacterium]